MNASAMELPVGDLTLSAIGSGNLSDAGRRSAHARAVVEGLAFAVRANAEQTREAANKHSFTPDQETRSHVGMSGGITRSRFWNQLVADVLGQPVWVLKSPEATGIGAAICAGVAAGLFTSLPQGVEVIAACGTTSEASVRTDLKLDGNADIYQPRPEASDFYKLHYPEWRRHLEAIAPADEIAAATILQAIIAED